MTKHTDVWRTLESDGDAEHTHFVNICDTVELGYSSVVLENKLK